MFPSASPRLVIPQTSLQRPANQAKLVAEASVRNTADAQVSSSLLLLWCTEAAWAVMPANGCADMSRNCLTTCRQKKPSDPIRW